MIERDAINAMIASGHYARAMLVPTSKATETSLQQTGKNSTWIVALGSE